MPNAFVVRMTRALDEAEFTAPDARDRRSRAVRRARAAGGRRAVARRHLRARRAELGRATLPSAEIVGLPPGAVVELNRQADEPIDLYVNGRRFATGRLMVVDGSDWAVRIETILTGEQQ